MRKSGPAFDRGRGRNRRLTRCVRAAALAPLELRLLVDAHRSPLAEIHRSCRGTSSSPARPFEAGLCEDPIEAFALGVRLDLRDPGTTSARTRLFTLWPCDRWGGAEIFEARVGAFR